MARAPLHHGRYRGPEQPLPSLTSLGGQPSLPPLAPTGFATRQPHMVPPRLFGAIDLATDSLIRPVLPRYDYHRSRDGFSASTWRIQQPPSANFVPTDPARRDKHFGQPQETCEAGLARIQPKKKNADSKLPLSPSPPTRARSPEPAAAHRPRIRSQRRREQCRTNQARYRLRQSRHIQRMEDVASRLREEIALLLMYREHLQTYDPNERMRFMARHIVEDYFRRFRNGVSGANIQLPLFTQATSDELALSPTGAATKTTINFKGECNSAYIKQVAFLRTMFLADADVGDGLFGPDAVLEQWWRYSCYFKRVHLALDAISMGPRVDDGERELVTATGVLTVRISSQSMQRVFPHVRGDSPESAALRDQLLRLPLRAQFEFVSEPGSFCRVASATVEIGVVAELLRVVGSAAALDRVLSGARISPHGYIGELQGHPRGDNAS